MLTAPVFVRYAASATAVPPLPSLFPPQPANRNTPSTTSPFKPFPLLLTSIFGFQWLFDDDNLVGKNWTPASLVQRGLHNKRCCIQAGHAGWLRRVFVHSGAPAVWSASGPHGSQHELGVCVRQDCVPAECRLRAHPARP